MNAGTFYLIDDCDTILCKLQNRIDEFYIEGVSDYTIEQIDQFETDTCKLQTAIQERDFRTLKHLHNKYQFALKRYQ